MFHLAPDVFPLFIAAVRPLRKLETKNRETFLHEDLHGVLVKKLLVNWLGEDQVGLVTRYLDEPGVRKNYMAINHAARESLR